MKYNLSEIMKAAWRMVKTMGMSMSKALKTAWASVKSGRCYIMVKDWFFRKLNAEAMSYRMCIDSEKIGDAEQVLVDEKLAETEKAIRVRLSTGSIFGSGKGWTTWIPKSCIVG